MTRSVTCSPIQNPSGVTSSAFGWPSGVLKSLAIAAFRTGGGGTAGFAGVRTSPSASGLPLCPKAVNGAVEMPAPSANRKPLRLIGNGKPPAAGRSPRAQRCRVSCAVQIAALRFKCQSTRSEPRPGEWRDVCFGKVREMYAVQRGTGRPGCGGARRVREPGMAFPSQPPQSGPDGMMRCHARRSSVTSRSTPHPSTSPSTTIAALSNPRSRAADTSRRRSAERRRSSTASSQAARKSKVKYGGTPEIPSEIAATRLLHALGFGADRVSRVDVVRCHGCPIQPFHTRALLEMLNLDGYVDKRIDYSSSRDSKR